MKDYITKDVIENHCSSISDGHSMDIHNDDNFLPFHRCYIEAMEDFLIKKGHPEYVPLPSWPPNTPVPTEFRTVDPDCPSAICDIGVSSSTTSNCSNPTNWNPNISRPSYLTLPVKTGTNNDLCDFIVAGNSQNSITRILEGQATNVVSSNYHNSVHSNMGGAMGYFTSPALPLFWCFHAYIDDIWKEYQCACPNKGGKALDLYMKDSPRVTAVTRDAGNEPNTDPGAMNISTDIWVRNQNDGKINFVNQNPIYSTLNYVYVRVRNRGCQTSSGSEQLVLHWSKGATAQTWPTYWNESITAPTLMGDTVSLLTIPPIPAGGSAILEIQWFPPNSANYSSNTTPKLFTLLARIVSANDPMATAEGTDVTVNTRNNNNIVMKNITIDSPPNVLPFVNITDPVNASQFIAPASIIVKANASDNDGSISKVEFYNGSTLLGTLTASPYTYTWNNVATGTYTLTAKAYDDVNAFTTSSPVNLTVKNNTLPVVAISSPVDGAVYIGPVNIALTATASDADGGISKVEFYNGAVLLGTVTTTPYTYNWSNVPVGAYTFTAKAFDDLNAVTTSTAVNILVNNNNLPAVSITAPLDGTSLIAPATVTIKANASDNDGSITKVEFYNGPTLIATSTTSPYTATLNSPPPGVYTLTAKAYDDLNAVKTSTAITLTINNNSLPVVNIISPSDGSTLIAPASTVIKVNATDSDGSISKVEFYNGATLLGEDNTSPYTFDWSAIPTGTYTLTAKAIDDLNAEKISAPVALTVNMNSAPTVSITEPLNGLQLIAPASAIIKVTATDIDGSISKVEFYDGGNLLATSTTSPYMYTWNMIPTGIYTLTAKAYDDLNAVTTSTVITLNVNDNAIPTVNITSPSNGATAVAPANFIIKAHAADTDGSISKVEFYEGATLLGAVVTSPYQFNWNNVPTGTYTLTAKVYDDLNAVKTSADITVVVNDNSLPSVTLISPVNNTTEIAPATLLLKANASDGDGSISKVEFYEGTTLIGSTSVSPYTFSWNNVLSGTYTLTAKAYDDLNAFKISATVNVLVKNNSLPTVSITSPVTGATAVSPATIIIKANASDSDGNISKVEFYNGNTLLGTSTVSPYTLDWTLIPAGAYILTAIAYDDLGAAATSADVKVTISTNSSPTVSITSPVTGTTAIAPASFTIKANASDSDGNISKVELYSGTTLLGMDLTSPYSFAWNNVAAGTYTLTAKAIDNLNAVTTSTDVNITVNSNNSPVVSLTEPTDGATFISPASFTIKANASDSDGSISKVEFYNGTTLLGSDNTSPYSFDWSNIGAGSYTLTAKAIDNLNLVTTSSEVIVTVSGNILPFVEITYPTNNEIFISPANITIEAGATDSDGTINKVEFYEGNTLLGTDVTFPYTYDWNTISVGAYTLTAKAYDNTSASSTSAEVKIVVEDNSLPFVSITSPLNGATLISPVTVNIDVDASDIDGTISKIEFYNGATLIGTDNVHPYTFEWAAVPVGDYKVIAKGFDNLNAFSYSDTVRFKVVINNAPTIAIAEPVNGTTLISPANTVIKVNASDSDGSITKVEFFEGTTLLGEDLTAPFSFDWNAISIGIHTITAKAYDDLNVSTISAAATITVKQNEAPLITLTLPVNATSAIAPAHFVIKATATDNDGSISKVEFYEGTSLLGQDNTSPYTFDWNNVPTGTYTLTAKAIDDLNATATSAIVTVTVVDNNLPTVIITSPMNGATAIAPANFTIKANATDTDGSISKVEFYNGSILLGISTSSPYTFDWSTVPTGNYTLTAKAFDDQNAVATSATVTLTVNNNSLPAVTILTPVNGATAIAPANFTIKANATDLDGNINKVELYNGATLLATLTTSPYIFNWNTVPTGTYTITAKAVDDLNASTVSTAVMITVKDNILPVVTISSPANGTTGIAPASFTIKANATDSDGSITKVEFYNGTSLLGTSSNSPYTYDWINIPAGVYTVTAKAIDDLNATTTSSAITVTITNNSAPTLSIIEPLNGAIEIAPANFNIKVNANDSDGSISRVEFYNGSSLIGTDVTSPYSQDWTNVPVGMYTLTAKAVDDLNAETTSNEIKITVKDNSAPTVVITAPVNGTTAIAPVNFTIKANAFDSDGTINRVEFYNGTTLLGTATTNPYTFDWNGVTAGIYILTAKAVDNLNAVTTSAEVKLTVNNNSTPSVTLIAPSNGTVTIAPASITLKANATDNDGSINRVEFFNGTSLIGTATTSPYTFDWNGVPSGVYLLTAKAYDDLGAAVTSAEVKVTVNNNSSPVVNITAPVTKATFLAPANISIKANASDSDGSIIKVEFYEGGNLLGTDVTSPYSFDWNNVVAGDYTLTAKAIDDLNASTISDNIKISVVNNTVPTVSITSPSNDEMFMPPASITITATAADINGSISKVEFYEGGALIGTVTTSPYSYNWTNVPVGDYELTAKAYDDVNAFTVSDTVKIMVAENMKPMVMITKPYDNEYFNVPANVIILAHALDDDGMIDKVEFYQGGILLGMDHMSPFEFEWNNVPPGNYELTAVAYDHMGDTAISSVVKISVDSNILPVTKITSPASGDAFSAPANMLITADASDMLGNVKLVNFYYDGTFIGADSVSPYETTWSNVPEGNYTLFAEVYDNLDAVNYSDDVLISVINNPAPTVQLTSPVDGSVLISGNDITITATAQDDGSIQRVDFYRGNIQVYSDSIAPYACIWKNAAAGNYTITAKAYDNLTITGLSNPVHITINDNKVPTVVVVSPLNNAILTGPTDVLLEAQAQDTDGSIKYVDFYNGAVYIGADSSSPFNYTWKNVPLGTYSITAKAVDNLNATGISSVVTFKVEANQLPVVTITSPANGTSYTAPATITIEADASDVNGSIVRVDFYRGNALIGSDSTSPYAYIWKNVGEGVYTLTAKAYDNFNAINMSPEIKVPVTDIPTGIDDATELRDLVLYPVPFDSRLHLNFNASKSGKINLKIYNETGSEVFTLSTTIASGEQIINIDTDHFPSGIYFLTIHMDHQLLKKKLLKIDLK